MTTAEGKIGLGVRLGVSQGAGLMTGTEKFSAHFNKIGGGVKNMRQCLAVLKKTKKQKPKIQEICFPKIIFVGMTAVAIAVFFLRLLGYDL